jgi:phage terminase large subunit-like protein
MASPDPVASLASLDEDALQLLMDGAAERDLCALDADWASWAHDGQRPGREDWRQWLIMAGRGFGKTRAGAEYVWAFARDHPGAAIALVGATAEEARAVMVEGRSGLIAVARADERPALRWRPSLRRLTFPGGAVATLYSAANPESLRGPEHHLAWCDELAKWPRGEAAWSNLQLGLRLQAGAGGAGRPRALITTTPRSVPLMKRLLADPATAVSHGPSWANPHVAADFLKAVEAEHGGTRFGRQEIEGVPIDDLEGALWTWALIERSRCAPPPAEALARIVIGVDPPASPGGTCGIVACARDAAGTGYVLADCSVTGAGPDGWSRAVANAAEAWGADRVVAEVNQGGDMVESVLRGAAAGLPVTMVRASTGKVARAEPVMAAFEAGRARLAGRFPALEDELTGLVYGGDYQGPGGSPDRADAMVWALTELVVKAKRAPPRVAGL